MIRTLTANRFSGNKLTGVVVVPFYPICSTISANHPQDHFWVVCCLMQCASLNARYALVTSTGRCNILFSECREGDVDNETTTEDLLQRKTEEPDVGSLAGR